MDFVAVLPHFRELTFAYRLITESDQGDLMLSSKLSDLMINPQLVSFLGRKYC